MHTSYSMNCCQLYWWWNWCNSSIYGSCISQLRIFFSFFIIILYAMYVRTMINMNRLFDLQVTLQCSIPRSLCAYTLYSNSNSMQMIALNFVLQFSLILFLKKVISVIVTSFSSLNRMQSFWLWKQVEWVQNKTKPSHKWCKWLIFFRLKYLRKLFAIRGNFNLFSWNLCLWPIDSAETDKQMQWTII